MNYAHVLLDSDDSAVTVVLHQCVTAEETAGGCKMLSKTYNNRMQHLYKILGKKGHTPIIQLTNLMNHKKVAAMIL